ncbi:MAG: hypothetical protein QOG82_187 [Actinomycetota bacterium]|nr:hypothetical protein [Actinomycetota bacterium]
MTAPTGIRRWSPRSTVLVAVAMAGSALAVGAAPAAPAAQPQSAATRLTMQPVRRTTRDLMAAEAEAADDPSSAAAGVPPPLSPDRPAAPAKGAPAGPANAGPPVPAGGARFSRKVLPLVGLSVSTNFNGATGPADTGGFPPDTMGAPGPSQFFVTLTGRMRTFTKATGLADGIVDLDSDVFFASVTSVPATGESVYTYAPQVRYDRLSARWFVTYADVIVDDNSGAITRANRILIAVSDAASAGTITAGTTWTFYQFQGDAANFVDNPSLGIDADALYIGVDVYTLAYSLNSSKGFVIPKAPLLSGAAAVVWPFPALATASAAGPLEPRGVDNPDPANTGPTAQGYFIGVDSTAFGKLAIRRITNPGSLGPAPTISANISVTTPLATSFPVPVPHLGNTGGTNGRLEAHDDRLYAAVMRNGRLWTAHNIGVIYTGLVFGTSTRTATRWYELQNLSTTPAVLQSGTVFDDAVTNPLSYWTPTITVSGQGHAAMGGSVAGLSHYADAWITGRLVGDALGTMQTVTEYTASSFAYNPGGNPGGASGRRWGDYSFTSVDPNDDMTMWTIQEYTNGTNTYGVRVAKLLAPPPATPVTASPSSVAAGIPSTIVTVTGTQVAGSGFFDPGAAFLSRLGASSTGVTVNSATYVNPTTVTLDISTVGATTGVKDLTVVNPDGQSLTGTGLLTVTVGAVTYPRSLPGVVGSAVNWSLHDSLATAGAAPDTNFTYGAQPPSVVPLVGDWDGNGTRTPGVFQAGAFKLSNTTTTNLAPAVSFSFGDPRGFPVAGDFNGDHTDDIAVFRAGQWQIRLSTGTILTTFAFGSSGSWPATIPVVGDWDGDGTDGIGTFSGGTWNLNNTADASGAEFGPFAYTAGTGSYPVVGDWDANGSDTVGVRQGTTWSLKNSNTAGFTPDVTPFTFGATNTLPFTWH